MNIEKEYRRLNIPSGDLRVSITNACNMKCVYCHNEGQQFEHIVYLSPEDINVIVRNSIRYGVFKIRITGGEPLIHPQIEEILINLKTSYPQVELGLNTNGMHGNKLLDICSKRLVDRVVIGLDYYDSIVSKNSCVGSSSAEIRDRAIEINKMGVKVEIATVLNKNIEDIYRLVSWGIKHRITVKVIEETILAGEVKTDNSFYDLIDDIANKYGLNKGITADLNEVYLTDNYTKVKFFQSHCNRHECNVCSRLHMRVNCLGEAEPCIMRSDTRYALLNNDFDLNMCKAIANLGNGPVSPII